MSTYHVCKQQDDGTWQPVGEDEDFAITVVYSERGFVKVTDIQSGDSAIAMPAPGIMRIVPAVHTDPSQARMIVCTEDGGVMKFETIEAAQGDVIPSIVSDIYVEGASFTKIAGRVVESVTDEASNFANSPGACVMGFPLNPPAEPDPDTTATPSCPNHWTGGLSGICPDCGQR